MGDAGHLDQGGDVPPGGDGDIELGDAGSKNEVVFGKAQAQPVVFLFPAPLLQPDDQVDRRFAENRFRAENIPDVDEPQAAQLHEMTAQPRGPADDPPVGPAADFNDIVRNEPVAPGDELDRALAFSHPAVAYDQHAQAEHPEQPARDDGRRGGPDGVHSGRTRPKVPFFRRKRTAQRSSSPSMRNIRTSFLRRLNSTTASPTDIGFPEK